MTSLLLLAVLSQSFLIHGGPIKPTSPPLVNLDYTLFKHPSGYVITLKTKPLPRFVNLPFSRALLHRIQGQTQRCTQAVELFCQAMEKEHVPCQPVSGYLFTHHLTPRALPFWDPRAKALRHRWARIFLPHIGWLGVDPLQRDGMVTPRHIPLASTTVKEITPWD